MSNVSPIFNANTMTLDQNTASLPIMRGTLRGWFRAITFSVKAQSVSGGLMTETFVDTTFMGVVQPLNRKDLLLKPEGQRSWQWLQIHALPGLVLNTDDIIKYNGENYRILGTWNWDSYGYVEYHAIKDYAKP